MTITVQDDGLLIDTLTRLANGVWGVTDMPGGERQMFCAVCDHKQEGGWRKETIQGEHNHFEWCPTLAAQKLLSQIGENYRIYTCHVCQGKFIRPEAHGCFPQMNKEDLCKSLEVDKLGAYDYGLPQPFLDEIGRLWGQESYEAARIGMVWLYDEKNKSFGRPYCLTDKAKTLLGNYNRIKNTSYPLT